MNLLGMGIADVVTAVGKVADDLFTSDKERAQCETEAYRAETERMNGQVEINKIEAGSESLFKSGWRPSAGWVCTATLALTYIPKAIVLTVFWCWQAYLAIKVGQGLPAYPDMGLTDILGLLFSLLGIGTMRSVEKVKGRA